MIAYIENIGRVMGIAVGKLLKRIDVVFVIYLIAEDRDICTRNVTAPLHVTKLITK